MKYIATISLALSLAGCAHKNKISVSERANIEKRIAELRPFFNYKLDSFTNNYSYQPIIDTATIMRSHIMAVVRSDGHYKLISFYVGDRFIYHDMLRFRINDTIYETKRKDSLTKKLYKRSINDEYFVERLYFDSSNDGGVVKHIFNSHGPILVVFSGSQGDLQRFTMPKEDVDEIKRSYELSTLLRRLADTASNALTSAAK